MRCEVCGFQIMKCDHFCSWCGAANSRNIASSPSASIKKGKIVVILVDGERAYSACVQEDSVWRIVPDFAR